MVKETRTVNQKPTGPQDFHTSEKENADRKKAEEQAAGIKRQDTQAPKAAPDVEPDRKSKPNDAPSEGEEGSGGEESGAPPPGSSILIPGTGTMSILVEGKPETIERGKPFKASKAMRQVLDELGVAVEAKGAKK